MRTVYDGLDEPEDIQKCLNCKRKECTNCLGTTTAASEYRKKYYSKEVNIQRKRERDRKYNAERRKVNDLKKYLRGKGL